MFKKFIKGNIIGLIELYRFISVFFTISIYIVHGVFEHYVALTVLVVVLCVAASAFLLNYLYQISVKERGRLHLLLIMEISGIAFLMLVTGGLESPFIWCFLNPLLIISNYLMAKLKVIYLSFNFILLCTIGFRVEKTSGISEYLLKNSNIIMSFVLILILVNVLFYYNSQIVKKQEELKAANNSLESYNTRIRGMTQDILFMYEAVHTVPEEGSYREIINIILEFAGRISPECDAFFMQENCSGTDCLVSLKPVGEDLKTVLAEKVKGIHLSAVEKKVEVFNVDEETVAVFINVSNIRNYGIMGLLIPAGGYGKERDEYEASLLLISQLSATFFEKIESETIGCELAVADEQNRIADDIHDSVIQRLFASSCFAYDTIKKWDSMNDENKKKQMLLLMETIQSSLTDLRSTIYNLSNKKQQIEFFKDNVKSYLEELERLSGIKINLEIKGDPDSFSLGARKALYRIITETTGNAIKHSGCSRIWVVMDIGDIRTTLTIRDDGVGFDLQKAEKEKNGLGLYNIKNLIRILGGSVNIISDKGNGTAFDMVFMNSGIAKKPDME